MNPDIRKYLLDVLQCIDEIKTVSVDIKSSQDIKDDFRLKRVLEREFEIIGEALNRCLKIEEGINIREIKRIIGLRNLIIHSYGTVDYIMLWQIIKNNLQNLEDDVTAVLNE
jgi:uncharacterized protein with HEPN domain